LMVPSTNTTMEPDLVRELADVATVHTARMYLPDPVTTAGERELLERFARPAARDLSGIDAGIAIFGCTSAGALLGAAGEERLQAELSELVGAPVAGVLTSAVHALQQRGATRISILTPYTEELNPTIERAMAAFFEVVSIIGMGIADNRDVGRCPPESVVEAADRAIVDGSDALFIACTNLRALEARAAIEATSGIPTVTANSAVVEAVRRELR
jgi:maleate isomerase